MKVLHISRSMGQGGAEKIVFQLCTGIKEVSQCVASAGGAYVDELKEQKIPHYLIPDIDGKNPFIILKTIKTLWSIVKKEKVDIIHTHHRMAAFYARVLQFFNHRLKHVYTAHNVFYGKRLLLRFALQRAVVVAVGNGVKENLKTEYGINEKRIRVIYNAIDTSELTGNNNELIDSLKESGYYVIGSIGRLSRQKGIDVLIKAMRELNDEFNSIKLVIIGDGEDRNKLEKLAKRLGVTDKIIFLGYQSNVLDIISQLEFVVLPSRWEGLPLTPIETFSQGKTIIATNIPGNNEIIVNQKNGLLFKKDNVADLVKKIKLLILDNQLKRNLEDSAYESYKNNYNYSVFLNGYKNVYKAVLGTKKYKTTNKL